MNFLNTHISKNAYVNVSRVLESTFISEGEVVKEFENQLCQKLGLMNPVAVNSGTTALHLALILAGVHEGDEVIIPPQTFIATGLAVLMQKAVPIFCDIQYETGNMHPNSLESLITERTKAIIPVHWGGYPCDMDEINGIAKKHGLVVIEDAAHALGALYKGKHVGAISEFTAFSFQAVKHLTTGDGGAICMSSEEVFERAMRLRWFGIDRKNSKPSILGEREYDLKELGYKYHMNNYAAALGLANLGDIDYILSRRRHIASMYDSAFASIPGITLLTYNPDRQSAYWLYPIHVEKRLVFVNALASRGIPANVMHLRIDNNSIFGGMRKGLDGMDKFDKTQICIPVHSDLSDDEVDSIINAVRYGW